LLGYSSLPVGPLERAERLEQLRAIENGFRIRVVETEYESIGGGHAGGFGKGLPAGRSIILGGVNKSNGQIHIHVTGGVVSSLGKGIAAASIGCLLESRG
jgi:hypothetical protein